MGWLSDALGGGLGAVIGNAIPGVGPLLGGGMGLLSGITGGNTSDAIKNQENNSTAAAQAQINAIKQAQQQELAYQQQAMQTLQNYGNMGMGAYLANGQNNLNLAGQNQNLQMPQMQAQQAMLSQGLPMLMQMLGMNPMTVSPNVNAINYQGMANGLGGGLQNAISQMGGGMGTPGTNGGVSASGSLGNATSGMPQSATGTSATPSSPINLMSMIQNNPMYQLSQLMGTQGLNRQLSGSGMQNSSDAGYLQGMLNQNNLANTYGSLQGALTNAVNGAMKPYDNSASLGLAQNGNNSLGNIGSMFGSLGGRSADMLNTMGQNQAGFTQGIGNTQAQNYINQGNYGIQNANAQNGMFGSLQSMLGIGAAQGISNNNQMQFPNNAGNSSFNQNNPYGSANNLFKFTTGPTMASSWGKGY